MYINNENNTIQYKHDIGEMAKGQIGLKWPSPCITNLHTYQSNQHKTNLKKNKTKTKKGQNKNKHMPQNYQNESRVIFNNKT